MNLDVVLGGLRKNGYRVSIQHNRYVWRYKNGYDCLPTHEISRHEVLEGDTKVFNNGGFTRVEITTPQGDVLVGKHNFSASKPFCRRIGVIGALGRAFGSQKNLTDLVSG